jgi:hypothetical protein
MPRFRPTRPPEPPIRPESFEHDRALYQDQLTIYAADMVDYLAAQVSIIEKHMNDMLLWQKRIVH